MGSSFLSSLVITLREGVEGALAVAIILLYLRKTGRQQLSPAVWWGLGTALAASIAGAYVLQSVALNSEIVEGVLMFVAAIFVGTMVVWMWNSAKGLKKEIENKVEEIASAPTDQQGRVKFGIFAFTFLMIVREGIETVIFLGAVNLTTNALLSFLGGILGLVLAVLFGIFFVRGSLKIDLGRFFKITGIVLILFIFQLLIGSVHELGEGGVINIGPRGMSIVGPIVKNNALFLIGILMIPALMLLIPGKTKETPAGQSPAERRLLLHQQSRLKMWKLGAAALSICIVLFIAFDFVYGQNRRLSPPKIVRAEGQQIRIPLSEVSDGNLHRFLLEGTKIRFIAMKQEGAAVAFAFDACEICGSHGYVQEGGMLICLNCSADINPATISQGGGCNPIPLTTQIVGDSFIIHTADLKKLENIFP